MKDNYKIIIWGFGQVGRSALQIINARKSLQLVGVYDVDPNKVGKDAGEIYGLGHAGVNVTDDVEKLLNTEADIVLYYPSTKWDEGKLPSPTSVTGNVDDIVMFLEHGKNVCSTLPVFFSEKNAPEYFKRIDEAGKAHGTTYTQQGIFPGLFTPYFSSITAMFSRRIDTAIVYGGEDDSVNSAPWIAVFGYGKKTGGHLCPAACGCKEHHLYVLRTNRDRDGGTCGAGMGYVLLRRGDDSFPGRSNDPLCSCAAWNDWCA